MTVKYHPSDDGKVIDGKTVVWVHLPRPEEEADGGPTDGDKGEAGQGKNYIEDQAAKSSKAAGPEGVKGADGTLAKQKAPSAVPKATAADKAASAKAQAASLTAAAKDGVPFCEECEKARQELARRNAES